MGTSRWRMWTRGRDSNSHDRSCSTMHNLSATTRCATRCLAATAIYGMVLGRSVNLGLMEKDRPHCAENLRCLGQQHKSNYNTNNHGKSLNGESSPASVSTPDDPVSPVALPHQTNPRTSIPADGVLCAR